MDRYRTKGPIEEKIALLTSIADAWNSNKINYAITHGVEGYPHEMGRDLDILISRDQVYQAFVVAKNILADAGCVVIRPPDIWGARLIAFHRNIQADDYIELHTVTQLSWATVTFAYQPSPSLAIGPFKNDPWASFAKRILLPVLSGDVERFRKESKRLKINLPEQEIASKLLPIFVGKKLAETFLQQLENLDLEGVLRLRNKLRCAVTLRAALRNPARTISRAWQKGWTRVRQFVSPCGPVVAIVGVDGAGKSTTIEAIRQNPPASFSHRTVLVNHWRPGLFPPLEAFLGRRAPVTGQGVAPRRTPGNFHWLRLLYYLADFILGYYIKDNRASSRQQLVLYDRCALDMSVDPVRYGLHSVKGTRLLWRLAPKPDLVVLLYADPECTHARKPDLSESELRLQLKEWLRLTEEGEIDACIKVDAGPAGVTDRIKSLIVEAFTEKNGGSLTSRNDHVQWLASILSSDIQSSLTSGGRPFSAIENSQGKHSHEFGMFALKDGRGYLIPMASRRAALRALELYNVQSRKAKIAKSLLTIGLQLGLARHCLRKIRLGAYREISQDSASDGHLLEHLKQILGRQDLQFGISLGTPGPHRKPVLLALTPDGTPLGYIKVGWDGKTNALIQNETQILRRLESTAYSSFTSPIVLHDGWSQGNFLCILAPPLGRVEAAPQTLTPPYLTAQKELMALHTCRVPLRNSRFWAALSQRIDIIQNVYYRSVLQQGASIVDTWLGDIPLPFHLSHGDFAPWNARMLNGRLFLFDWEYSTTEAPPGYDLFHFTVQTARLLHKRSPGQLCQAFQHMGTMGEYVSEQLGLPGLEEMGVKSLLLLYVMAMIAGYASEHGTHQKTLRYFAHMANIIMLKE